jgi:hypothetical protein
VLGNTIARALSTILLCALVAPPWAARRLGLVTSHRSRR